MVTHGEGRVFSRSATPLHLRKCVARFVSNSWISYRKKSGLRSNLYPPALAHLERLSETLSNNHACSHVTLSLTWNYSLTSRCAPPPSMRVTLSTNSQIWIAVVDTLIYRVLCSN